MAGKQNVTRIGGPGREQPCRGPDPVDLDSMKWGNDGDGTPEEWARHTAAWTEARRILKVTEPTKAPSQPTTEPPASSDTPRTTEP